MAKKKYVYVWEDVLTDYSSGLVVAVAANKEEALEAVKKAGLPDSDRSWGVGELRLVEPQVIDVSDTEAVAFYVSGGS